MNYRKICFTFLIVFVFFTDEACNAQIKSIHIGVDGLTCSACCRSVEMSIRKLRFVKEVKMNLDNSEGQIYFADNEPVNLEGVARAVVREGFSVRFLNAIFDFHNLNIYNGYCYLDDQFTLQFVNINKRYLNGEMELKFIGERFQTKSEYNKIKSGLKVSCLTKNKNVNFVTF